MRLDGKVTIITGGGSGMGKTAAEMFAKEGARVVVSDVSEKAGEGVVAAVRAAGGQNPANPFHYEAIVHTDRPKRALVHSETASGDSEVAHGHSEVQFARPEVAYAHPGCARAGPGLA